jgi:hypothetical protein
MFRIEHFKKHASLLQRLPWLLTLTAVSLVILSSLGQLIRFTTDHDHLWGFTPLFSLNAELNAPSFFSASILALAATILLFIFTLKQRSGDGRYWFVLSLGFFYLCVDEALSLHELLIAPTQQMFGREQLSGFYLMAWALPGLLGAVILALTYLRFLWRQPASTRIAFIISGSLYLGGALGLEMMGSWYMEFYGWDNPGYTLLWTVEESMEMAGVILFIRALLNLIQSEDFMTQSVSDQNA